MRRAVCRGIAATAAALALTASMAGVAQAAEPLVLVKAGAVKINVRG